MENENTEETIGTDDVLDMGDVLEKRVGFYCPRYSLRIEITHPQSLTADPAATQHPDRKMVQFVNGLYSTDDPEIITALDKRNDVYRVDDPRVPVLEEVAGEEPEDKEKILRAVQKASNIGEFSRHRGNLPGMIPVQVQE